jgi:flavin-dependent dehydrogenase
LEQPGVQFDVGIIGGGPAGSALAAYLAAAGVKVILFEREIFPRPHVGESLVPSSTRAFQELGFLETMEEAGFPRKFGAVWTATGSSAIYEHDWEGLEADHVADIRFGERKQPGIEQTYTWHVDRGKFDLLLLQHAQKRGTTVLMGAHVKHVDTESALPVIRYSVGGAHESEVRVRIVVDASGRRTQLGTQLGHKVADPMFDQFAIHTWFEGLDRKVTVDGDGTKGEYIFVHFLPLTNSWVWQIPISDTITSIGVVTQRKHFRGSKVDREQFFWNCVSSRPELHDALRASKQVRPFTEEGDYSYAMTQIIGDNWLLVGDAARFVDPIFSTGVSIALNSARFAHLDILEALRTGDTSRSAYTKYEATIRRGTRNWYNFITVYYRLNVLFTAFIRDPRYRLDVLKLLQGDVYDEDEPEVLTKMREIVSEVENNPDHVWHKLLGDLTADAFRPSF